MNKINKLMEFDMNILEKMKINEYLQMNKIILGNVIEGIVITNKNGDIQWANEAFTKITGYTKEECIGKNPRILKSEKHTVNFYKKMWKNLKEKGYWEGEIWNRRKNGQTYPEWLVIAEIKNEHGEIINYVSMFIDFTEQIKKDEIIKYQFDHDALTGLPNRNFINKLLDLSLNNAKKKDEKLAVIFMDIDRFKRINDTLGHNVGDKLLQMFSKKIKNCIKEENIIARLGGDEFVLILKDVKNIKNIIGSIYKIFSELKEPFILKEHETYITVSMGVSMYPSDGEDAEALIKNAEVAMYRVKETGKNNYELYSHHMDDKSLEQLKIENDMMKAIKNEEFILHYQPQIDANSGKLIGAEALIRWDHPELGTIYPDKFIPLAEETGFIIKLGEWVLKTAISQNKIWQEKGFDKIKMAVNVSAIQLRSSKFVHELKKIVDEIKLEYKYLEIEITETNAMFNPEFTIKILSELEQMGVTIAIDDFGTGYSSLAYFRNFPIHKLKIDKSFIRDIEKDKKSQGIVLSIIDMTKRLELESIAEGVETDVHMSFLKKHGCDQMQGYYIGRPMPAKEVERLLSKKS